MPTPRLATSILLRASRSAIPHTARQFRALPSPSRPTLCSAIHTQTRTYSTPTAPPYSTWEPKTYTYTTVKAISENPNPEIILIDTREPAELQTTGTIPNSVNIPITSKPDSFFITPEEFEDRFGFEMPGKEKEVVFFCKAGVRSRAAAALARQAGWLSIGEYRGSWLDWEKNGGRKEGGRV